MGLSDRDHQERPAVHLQRSPDDGLAVAQPRSMDEGAPTPAAVAQLTMDALTAARAKLAVSWQPRRSDPGDDFFSATKSRSLLIRVRWNDPPLPLRSPRRIEREEAELSLRFSLGAHSRPASASGVRRSAAGQREVRRPAAPPVHVLMAAHHLPRATRVRIPYAPPQSSAWSENHLVERFIRSGEDGNARILRTSLRTSKSAHGPS